MEPEQVRRRIAIALGLKMGVPNEQARIVGDTVLRVISDCGLITLAAADLAQINELVRAGQSLNVRLVEALVQISEIDPECGAGVAIAIADAAIKVPDDIIIEGELAPQGEA